MIHNSSSPNVKASSEHHMFYTILYQITKRNKKATISCFETFFTFVKQGKHAVYTCQTYIVLFSLWQFFNKGQTKLRHGKHTK